MTRFDQQCHTMEEFIIPFLDRPVTKGMKVLEVGCAEGGGLMYYARRGCNTVVGIDTSSKAIANGIAIYSNYNNVHCFCGDITNPKFFNIIDKFDLIILKDTIEHIENKRCLLHKLHSLLKPGGRIFISFPPWHSPYGGHQQVARLPIPFMHLLPNFLYTTILFLTGNRIDKINGLLDIKEAWMTMRRMRRFTRDAGFNIIRQEQWLISPNYKYRYGIRPRKQWKVITHIPFLRCFMNTCVYYLLSK